MIQKEINKAELSPLLKVRFEKENRGLLIYRTYYLFMVATILYPSFWGLDWLTIPDEALFFLYIRLAVGANFFIGALLIKLPIGEKIVLPISLWCSYVSVLGVVIMTIYLDGFFSHYYIGIVLLIFIPGLFLPWDLISSLIFGFFSIATYFTLNLMIGYPPSVNLMAAAAPFFFMMWSFFFMAFANVEKRKTHRQEFMLRIQIEKANADLKELDKTKKDFIANVTHELRTPLTLIRGWTDFMLNGESGEIPKNLMEIINKVGIQTLSLTEKINELLKVSKFDAGMSKLVLTKEDINAYVDQIVTSFKGLTDQSGVDLNFFGSPDIGHIFIDREKLKDILNNLIRNAYKFTETGEIKVILSKKEDRMILKVKDTGIGMPPDVQKKIFQRFQQGDGSRTRNYEGTGLGLAIVKDSVEMMSGKVSVESVPGQGTVFAISLPLGLEVNEPHAVMERRMKDRRASTRKLMPGDRRQKDRRLNDLAKIDTADIVRIMASENPLAGKTVVKKIDPQNSRGVIVIAEDNSAIQDFLSTALKGYTLYIAGNGQAAWQTIQETMPGLVISDIMMPIMDGYSLLEKIRSNEQTTTLPVIIITSLTEQNDRIKALQLGADDFLTKPFHHLELQARVKNVLSVHRLEREKARSDQLEVFLMVLASVIESKDKYTGGHVERVAGYARDLALKAGLPEGRVTDIYLGTIVHDVGKIGVRDEVLNKPGKLTDEEFEHIKEHPVIGRNLLAKLEIAPVAVNIAYSHQEKWNGTGYPEGLSKTGIPIEARIATIADFWDAITSDRPYRKAMPLEKAIGIMHEERGKSFDPELFDLFMDDTDRLYQQYISPDRLTALA
ncbi:HD domain-containing phosphohydrolase [Desulfobacula sp.]|uniref:HD domain-containing phosphohydrolase n=1 Tax=Desulfobacula sp. TaxID=2593537 RepID=UPI00260A1D36|nr:HD domain-containing phosphohydrolase [Desulfobacula sp.]